MLSRGESICKSIKYSDSIKPWNFCSKINRITILVSFLLLKLKNTLDQKSTWERKGFLWLTVPDLSPLLRGVKAGIPGRPTCCSTQHCLWPGRSFPSQRSTDGSTEVAGCWRTEQFTLHQRPCTVHTSCPELQLSASLTVKQSPQTRPQATDQASVEILLSDGLTPYQVDNQSCLEQMPSKGLRVQCSD